MNQAVKFHGTNPRGIPSDWPSETRSLGEATGPLNAGETLMSDAELAAYKAARQSTFDQWHADDRWRQSAVSNIKAEAQRRIFALTGYSASDPIPGIIRQLNLIAAANRIIARKLFQNIDPSEGEAAFVSSSITLVDKVLAVRTFSDGLEARAVAGEVFDILAQAWPY